MIDIEKDGVLYSITLEDENGVIVKLNFTKKQMSEIYGKLGHELSKCYQEDLKEFFRKSKEHKGTEKAVDAVSTQEIPEPEVDWNRIWLESN